MDFVSKELINLSFWTIFNLVISLDQPKVLVASTKVWFVSINRLIQPKRGTLGCYPSLVKSFQRYWLSKDHAIRLDKSILAYNLWSIIFQDKELKKKTDSCNVFHIRLLQAKSNGKILKTQETSILEPFCQLNFSGKFNLLQPHQIQNPYVTFCCF